MSSPEVTTQLDIRPTVVELRESSKRFSMVFENERRHLKRCCAEMGLNKSSYRAALICLMVMRERCHAEAVDNHKHLVNILSLTKLSDETGFDKRTVEKTLHLLRYAGLIFDIPEYVPKPAGTSARLHQKPIAVCVEPPMCLDGDSRRATGSFFVPEGGNNHLEKSEREVEYPPQNALEGAEYSPHSEDLSILESVNQPTPFTIANWDDLMADRPERILAQINPQAVSQRIDRVFQAKGINERAQSAVCNEAKRLQWTEGALLQLVIDVTSNAYWKSKAAGLVKMIRTEDPAYWLRRCVLRLRAITQSNKKFVSFFASSRTTGNKRSSMSQGKSPETSQSEPISKLDIAENKVLERFGSRELLRDIEQLAKDYARSLIPLDPALERPSDFKRTVLFGRIRLCRLMLGMNPPAMRRIQGLKLSDEMEQLRSESGQAKHPEDQHDRKTG